MIKFTKAQLSVLKKYENYLITAYKSDYIRGLPQSQALELSKVASEVGLRHTNMACGACKLKLCKDLGRIYFAQVPTKTSSTVKTKNGETQTETEINTENDGKSTEIDNR